MAISATHLTSITAATQLSFMFVRQGQMYNSTGSLTFLVFHKEFSRVSHFTQAQSILSLRPQRPSALMPAFCQFSWHAGGEKLCMLALKDNSCQLHNFEMFSSILPVCVTRDTLWEWNMLSENTTQCSQTMLKTHGQIREFCMYVWSTCKVKSAFEPCGPSDQHLSRVQQHQATKNIFTPAPLSSQMRC